MNTQKCISDADFGRLLENDLTVQEKQAFHQHMEDCPACRDSWRRISTGARYVEQVFSEAAPKDRKAGCLSGDVLQGLVDETLDAGESNRAREHLMDCPHCRDALAEKLSEAYETEGASWWSQYVGRQLLGLLARLPGEELEPILHELGSQPARRVTPALVIKLPVLQPAERQAERLAAATGEGFSVQRLHQDDPPFDFELVQFGEQVRITARVSGEDRTYADCLAELQLMEGGRSRRVQYVLISEGQGQCVLQPEEVRELRLQKEDLSLRLQPLQTAEDLARAGSDVYMPILERLIAHSEPHIRQGAIQVIARIGGPEVCELIEPLTRDRDPQVRAEAEKALRQFPWQNG